MSTDLTMLVWASFLALVQLCLYAVPGVMQLGVGYAAGARDEGREVTGFAGRMKRAYANHLETLPLFAAAVVVAHLTGRANDTTALLSQVYFWSRVAYIPAYGFGIPYLRSAIWSVATIAIVGIFAVSIF